ncbi:MAG TPA: hypothetical protein PLJ84_06835 [Bacteroidales bacterium]|mgnify:CR=1 FL=1|nr:hypothetical protein [Bacteroidales bacterium]HPT02297.1 hypothetical protein [Bacteroidales bacterium]
MNTSAIILWLSVSAIVTGLCGYFFFKVLSVNKKKEPDSYSDNE